MVAPPVPSRAYRWSRRLFDLVFAALLLFVSAPVLALLALLTLLESGRPVLFRQPRVGQGGRTFEVVKLRTLRTGDHDPDDPLSMVTRVGRFARRWGLDELPQLWNVLKGDMSTIGPRPTLPEQVARYSAFERRRLEVPQGLTGWAQVHGRNALSWPERIRLDVWYVDHRCWRLDLKILLRTPGTLLSGRGVYGEGGQNPDFLPPAS